MIGQPENTALILAVAKGKASMVTLLVDKGADINHRNQVRYHLSMTVMATMNVDIISNMRGLV